jgi:hypothetical protein
MDFLVYQEEVDRARLAGGPADLGDVFSDKAIEKRRFADIRPAGKGDFGQTVRGKLRDAECTEDKLDGRNFHD